MQFYKMMYIFIQNYVVVVKIIYSGIKIIFDSKSPILGGIKAFLK